MGRESGGKGAERREMYEAILKLETYEQCRDFFRDLCTGRELAALEQRYEVARMLKKDNVYMEIMRQTSASSATISRVKRMLSDGTGCLSSMIDRED